MKEVPPCFQSLQPRRFKAGPKTMCRTQKGLAQGQSELVGTQRQLNASPVQCRESMEIRTQIRQDSLEDKADLSLKSEN